MLLSLVMCFSLLSIPTQAAFTPGPNESDIIYVGGPKNPKEPVAPGDEDPDEPNNLIQPLSLPAPLDNMPTD